MSQNLIDVIYGIPHQKVSRGEKFLLKILIQWGNGVTKNIEASFQFLKEVTGYSNRSVRRMIASLEKKSLISIKKSYKGSCYGANKYTIFISKLRNLSKLKMYEIPVEYNRTNNKTIDKNDIGFLSTLSTSKDKCPYPLHKDKCPYPPTPSKAYPSSNLVRPQVFTESPVAWLSSNLNSSPVVENKKILKINVPVSESEKSQKSELKHIPKTANENSLHPKNSREIAHHALIEKLKMKTRDKFLRADSRMPEVSHDAH